MEQSRNRLKKTAHRKAFTLVELLVVIVALALLAALTLPALAGNKDQIRIAQCAGNLRQFSMAFHNYGNENNNRLPNFGGAGSWAWDVSLVAADVLLRSGAKREQMYDPGFPEQNDDRMWNLGPYRIIGYAVTFPGSFVKAADQNTSLTPQYTQFASVRNPPPDFSRRALLACATLNRNGTSTTTAAQVLANPTAYNFTAVVGLANFPSPGQGHRAPHLTGTIPAGGNLAMLDGHVEWREFKDMTNRTTGSPFFWW